MNCFLHHAALKVLKVSLLILLVSLASLSQVSGFAPIAQKNHHYYLVQLSSNQNTRSFHRTSCLRLRIPLTTATATATTRMDYKLNLIPISQEQQLELWITTFSAAHIGMSAVRDRIIHTCGELAKTANLIDRGFKLPSYWPGDDFGKDEIFPDVDTAGRQIYRLLYTMVSFITLGNALGSYIHSNEMRVMILSDQDYIFLYGVASLSFAASIASLFNASPMSLMPSFEKVEDGAAAANLKSGSSRSTSIVGIQRNDSLKMEPKGLTRITRHPLILPVVPWGVSTSYLAGGRTVDFILFCGLALYAIAGCACQDLRIIRKEGSVGTVMRINTSNDDTGTLLETFYGKTSFVPFAAVVDGRQSMDLLLTEFPSIPFIVGIPIGAFIQDLILQLIIKYGY